MAHFPESYPHGDAVDNALREKLWSFPPDNTARFKRPEIVHLSLTEKIKALATVMHDLGGLLLESPYLSEKDDAEKGISRLPFRAKIQSNPGSLPTLAYTSFSYYREKELNHTGLVLSVDSPYKLVVGAKVNPEQEAAVRQAEILKTGHISSGPIAHTFTHFFSKKGDSLITFTPAPTKEDVQLERVPVPIPVVISADMLNVARDNLWLLYEKANECHVKR
jgi:hypothetical protein